MLKLKNVFKPPILNQMAVQGSHIKGNFKPDRMADSDPRIVVGKYVFLTKTFDKTVKFCQKTHFSLNKSIHTVIRLN